jgi:hypothetical protein
MKLGRNDPCHCGSGKKYKHCHYEADRAAEAKALKEAADARAAQAAEAAKDEPDDSKPDDGDKDAAMTKPHKRDGSRFLRDSSRGGHGQKGNAASASPRSTRGAQRGG